MCLSKERFFLGLRLSFDASALHILTVLDKYGKEDRSEVVVNVCRRTGVGEMFDIGCGNYA